MDKHDESVGSDDQSQTSTETVAQTEWRECTIMAALCVHAIIAGSAIFFTKQVLVVLGTHPKIAPTGTFMCIWTKRDITADTGQRARARCAPNGVPSSDRKRVSGAHMRGTDACYGVEYFPLV